MSLESSNRSKLQKLDTVEVEALRVLNLSIDYLWQYPSTRKFDKPPAFQTWLSYRFCQCLFIQAFNVLKKLRARKNKAKKVSKPIIKNKTFDVTKNICTFYRAENSFDFWIKVYCLGNKINLNIPSRKHKQFLKYSQSGWKLLNSSSLRKINGKWFLDVFFEKAPPAPATGTSIGLDCGYKKLLASSDQKTYDVGMEVVYKKIVRKKQGSKAFKRALIERNQKINQSVKLLDLKNIQELVVEDLKDVKKSSKGKIRKQFMNKLQRWSYPKVLDKLQMVSEEVGVKLLKVSPAYTSQTCSLCGAVDKLSRKGESFCCTACGMKMDADFNAAKNILMRGVYSPPSVTNQLEII